jgi:hypothetical protein
MIGKLIDPTIINIAVIFSPKLSLVNEFFKKIMIRYSINKIATDVKRASHTHQVPHMGLPHNEPVIKQIRVKVAPIGATAALTMKLKGVLNASPMMLYTVIIKKVNKASQADGT